MDFGVRYQVFDRNGYVVTKEKFFIAEKSMQSFMKRVEKQNNFYQFLAYCYPEK